MNKIINKLLQLFKRSPKTKKVITPKPNVKRQNAVPVLKDIENKSHKKIPKKKKVMDIKTAESSKKPINVKANENKDTDIVKPKKKKHYGHKKIRAGKPILPKAKVKNKNAIPCFL